MGSEKRMNRKHKKGRDFRKTWGSIYRNNKTVNFKSFEGKGKRMCRNKQDSIVVIIVECVCYSTPCLLSRTIRAWTTVVTISVNLKVITCFTKIFTFHFFCKYTDVHNPKREISQKNSHKNSQHLWTKIFNHNDILH